MRWPWQRQERVAKLTDTDGWLFNALTLGGATDAEETVTEASALGVPAFWRGVQILSGVVGSLPLVVYHRTADGRERVSTTSQAWTLLHDKPNPNQPASEFWALVESHLVTWGNAFIWKEKDATTGRVTALWALKPSRVHVAQIEDGTLRYIVDGNVKAPLDSSEILHIRGPSSDGVVGYSPVQIHRQTIGGQQAQSKFWHRFMANSATPGVALIHSQKLNPEAVERLRALWENHHKGPSKAGRAAVLGEDIKVQQMTMPLRDAQFIEQWGQSAKDVSNILGVPVHMLGGGAGDSLTYSTSEGHWLDFLKTTLGPQLRVIEQAVSNDGDLLPGSWYAEFLAENLLRGTTTERYTALGQATWMTVNEKRRLENLPPIEGGDALETQDTPEEGDDGNS